MCLCVCVCVCVGVGGGARAQTLPALGWMTHNFLLLTSSMSFDPRIKQVVRNFHDSWQNHENQKHPVSESCSETSPCFFLALHWIIVILYYQYVPVSLWKASSCSKKMLQHKRWQELERDHITPVWASLHWLPVKFRIEFKILVLTTRALHIQPLHMSKRS